MANLANLVNFSAGSLAVGDWTYSAYGLTAPSYLPLNNETASYLASSYPTLAALYTTPVTAYSATARTAINQIYGDKGIAYGNGIWVAVTGLSSAGQYLTSLDGINWTLRTMVGSTDIAYVVFGNGIFVAIQKANTGYWYSSSDGVTWSISSGTIPGPFIDMAYGNKQFLALGGPGATTKLIGTPDGFYSTINTPLPSTSTWTCICYGNGTFVALAGISTAGAYSTNNGASWTASTLPSTATWSSVAYGNGTFVAVSGAAKGLGTSNSTSAATSPDGITWTARTLPTSQAWSSVTFGNGLFFAVGYTSGSTGTVAATSPDGITWTTRTMPSSRAWGCVAVGGPTNNQFFVAMDSGSANAATINLSVAQTTFSLPPVPILKNNIAYIKAT